MPSVTKNVAAYVSEKGINVSKMSRSTGIPYPALYSSLCDEERERKLRVDEFLDICDYLDVEPRRFRERKDEVKVVCNRHKGGVKDAKTKNC